MATKKIKIRYLKSNDFRLSLATGVFGGISNNGLIVANFFTERPVFPDSETLEVDEFGNPVGQPIYELNGDVMRELQSGVIMDINTAKVVIRWLEGKIDDYTALNKKKM